MTNTHLRRAALVAMLGWVGCGGGEQEMVEMPLELGPADGQDLPAMDLERLQLGDPAPDFTLASFDGSPVTLSDFRGDKNVILVFYRGHW